MDGAAASSGSEKPAANGAKHEEQPFDPSRMIGIIKRKALVKELAAAYHAECMASCKELLQLQRMWEKTYKQRKDHEQAKASASKEQYAEAKMPEELISSMPKTFKRRKR